MKNIDKLLNENYGYGLLWDSKIFRNPELLSFIGWDGTEESPEELLKKLQMESLFIIKDYWKQEDAIEVLYQILIHMVAN